MSRVGRDASGRRGIRQRRVTLVSGRQDLRVDLAGVNAPALTLAAGRVEVVRGAQQGPVMRLRVRVVIGREGVSERALGILLGDSRPAKIKQPGHMRGGKVQRRPTAIRSASRFLLLPVALYPSHPAFRAQTTS